MRRLVIYAKAFKSENTWFMAFNWNRCIADSKMFCLEPLLAQFLIKRTEKNICVNIIIYYYKKSTKLIALSKLICKYYSVRSYAHLHQSFQFVQQLHTVSWFRLKEWYQHIQSLAEDISAQTMFTFPSALMNRSTIFVTSCADNEPRRACPSCSSAGIQLFLRRILEDTPLHIY